MLYKIISALIALMTLILIALLHAIAVTYIFNVLISDLFELRQISYIEGAGIILFARLVFGNVISKNEVTQYHLTEKK